MKKKNQTFKVLLSTFLILAGMMGALIFGAIEERWTTYAALACVAVCLGGVLWVMRIIFNDK